MNSWFRQFWKRDRLLTPVFLGFPGGSDGKEFTCNEGDLGLIPGLGRCPRGGHGNPVQDSCLENPMDRGAWPAIVHGVAKSQKCLRGHTHTHTYTHTHTQTQRAAVCFNKSFICCA